MHNYMEVIFQGNQLLALSKVSHFTLNKNDRFKNEKKKESGINRLRLFVIE